MVDIVSPDSAVHECWIDKRTRTDVCARVHVCECVSSEVARTNHGLGI